MTARALRFYEDKGFIEPARAGQARTYSEQDRLDVQLLTLGRKADVPLKVLSKILETSSEVARYQALKKAILARADALKKAADVTLECAEVAGRRGDKAPFNR